MPVVSASRYDRLACRFNHLRSYNRRLRSSNGELRGKLTEMEVRVSVYPGSQHMCITNEDLSKGRGNGTMCKCVKVRLKQGRARWWKNWEGKKVWTTSADDVDWVEFEHYPEAPKGQAKQFKLKSRQLSPCQSEAMEPTTSSN